MTVPSGYVVSSAAVSPVGISPPGITFAELGSYHGSNSYDSAKIAFRSKYTDEAHPITANKIEGWKWDQMVWIDEEMKNNFAVPTIYDATTSGITESYFRSGIGGGTDLELDEIEKVTVSGLWHADTYQNIWALRIKHGNYFIYDERSYLHSDDSEYINLEYADVVPGISTSMNKVTLTNRPKIGVPIVARQYAWDSEQCKYLVSTDVRQKSRFTGIRDADNVRQDTYNEDTEAILYHNIDAGRPEFVITWSGLATYPSLVFNDQFCEAVGGFTGETSVLIGYLNGSDGQLIYTQYSPIDSSKNVKVYTTLEGSGVYQEWTVIAGLDTELEEYQVGVDYDLGIFKFPGVIVATGGGDVSGFASLAGYSVYASYYKTLQIEYEAEDATDDLLCLDVNANMIRKYSDRGFVFVTDESYQPFSIILEAELDEISEDVFGPVYLGNVYASLIATVYNRRGLPLEDIDVTFEITSSPTIGYFSGGETSIEAVTNAEGQAKTYYNTPAMIDEIGEQTTTMATTVAPPEYPGVTQITKLRLSSLQIEGGEDEVFLFKVLTDDPFLGYRDYTVPDTEEDQLESYYSQFFDEESITGSTGNVPGTTTTSPKAIDYEATHRLLWDLARPALFGSTNTGKKILVATDDNTALDPHDYTTPSVSPFQPIDIIALDPTGYDIVYDTSSFTLDAPSGDFYSYFIVAPTSVKIKAKAWNAITREWVYSNEISLQITIPPHMSGLWIIEDLNNISLSEISSILAAMLPGDLIGKRIPFGWRLKSSTITLASALGGICFLDVNETSDPDIWPGRSLVHSFDITSIS